MKKFPTPSLSVRSITTGLLLLGLLTMPLLFAPIGVAQAQAVTTTQLQQEFAAKVAAIEKQHGGRHDDCRTE